MDVFHEMDSVELTKLTKIDRILYYQKLKKQKEGLVVTVKKDEYYLNAFVNEMSDPNFVDRFDVEKENGVEIKTEKEQILNDSVDIDGYIIIEPILISTSDKKGVDKKDSENRSNNMQKLIADISEKLDIHYVLATREGNKNNLVSEYNGEAATKEWYYQYYTYEEYNIIPLNTSELYEYASRNNTSYVYHTWIYSIKESPNFAIISYLIYTAPLYPVFPALIYYCATKKQFNYVYNKIIDIHTNEYVLDTYDETNKKIREYNIRSILYNKLNKLK